ncbi:PREDICTED: uncharacterized protein LOC108620299 [Drosophila arizonae]|uniref:Uncharacterized protein LOC108620299 n=1 Tax=Drosophila arizonae TaxID=7263 RepID=A0ABM1PZQ7_DROAR|nr:PREDICTED: uncharacterized protein LOC108620299 [Drosophila arizonae]
MYLVKAVLILIFVQSITQTLALNALNNYGNSVYPDRCVVDMGTSVVLLKFGESVKLDSLPCTQIFCIGDGWGMLETCDFMRPNLGCRYTSFKDWEADYPDCCKRNMVCD